MIVSSDFHGDVVNEFTDAIYLQIAHCQFKLLREAQYNEGQLPLKRIADREFTCGPQLSQSLSSGAELRVGDNVANPHVRIQKVNTRIAFGVQNFVIVECVVVDSVLFQIEILDG